MSELWANYWPVVIVAVVIGLLLGLWAFRPRQRVTLSRDSEPRRPHMTAPASPSIPDQSVTLDRQPPSPRDRDGGGEGEGITDGAAAAASDIAGAFLGTAVHDQLPGSQGIPDDFQRMKGVGPKFATLLGTHGITRFADLAALDDASIASLDDAMGPFKGRLARDRVIEQAGYLAAGNHAGYEAQFGKL